MVREFSTLYKDDIKASPKYSSHLVEGVGEPAGQLGGAAVLLQQVEAEGPVPPRLVNIGDGAQERAEDDLRQEEVRDLQ